MRSIQCRHCESCHRFAVVAWRPDIVLTLRKPVRANKHFSHLSDLCTANKQPPQTRKQPPLQIAQLELRILDIVCKQALKQREELAHLHV